MGEFPFTVRLGGNVGAEDAAEDLMAKTDACEADVRAVDPEV